MGHMLKAARHDAIVELLRDRPAMRTVDVARNLNVSMATARRDCIALENKGIIERSWGGIQLVTSVDDHFGDVMNHHTQAKAAIARKATELIHDGDTIIMDIGTTVQPGAPSPCLLHPCPSLRLSEPPRTSPLSCSGECGRSGTSALTVSSSLTR